MFLISVGLDIDALRVIKQTKIKIILVVPLSVTIGSLIGAGCVYHYFFQVLMQKEGMAVGAGFGYYSLSSILITEISSDFLGSIALLSNIKRIDYYSTICEIFWQTSWNCF